MPLIWSEELETQLENFLIESIIPTHEQVFQLRVCFKYIVERQDPCTPPDKDWKLSIEAKSLAELLLKANQSWKEKGYNLLKYFFLYRRIKHLSSPKEMIEKIIYDFDKEFLFL